MRNVQWWAILGLASVLLTASPAAAQVRPYIGYVYPAGGQQGTTFRVKVGGQNLDDVNHAVVSGKGVKARIVQYYRRLSPQEIQLLNEQMRELKRTMQKSSVASVMTQGSSSMSDSGMMADNQGMTASDMPAGHSAAVGHQSLPQMMAKIEKRISEYVLRPACSSIATLAWVEVTVAPDAEPGEREIRLVTPRGVSNPMVFHVGQLPEFSRKAMTTAHFQVLGKEELALRKRPDNEIEDRVTVPCTVNGQIASGEVNRYRFEAHKGQRLVISTEARALIPYIADAVPGWFQPVLTLYNSQGKELAYDDDYRFKPDPIIYYEVPKDGEYVFGITDAIYRGREDFVYRVTIGESPFVTSIFPLGARAGDPVTIEIKGWNLPSNRLTPPELEATPGVRSIVAHKDGFISNPMPFARDVLPECMEKEPNNDLAHAQKVKLPIIINGRINRPDDWDVFQFTGRAGESVVAEVYARRLESPLDSVLKLTDAAGNLLAYNDDYEDAGSGVNTHHADSYLMAKLPADGTYFVHLGDTARSGGEEYAYRLRISAPRPDFALRCVPSSIGIRSKGNSTLTVHVIRKDGFAGPIKLNLKNPPPGFSAYPVTMSANQAMARLTVKTDLAETKEPVALVIEGRAKIGDREVAHDAVPAEDRMQAFLWRHLVPAQELSAWVFDPSYVPSGKRIRKQIVSSTKPADPKPATADAAPVKQKFSKAQVAGRLRQIELLFQEGLITEEFEHEKVKECEAAQ